MTAPRQSLISQRRPVQKIPITDFGCEQIGDPVFAEQGCNRASRCRLVDQVELAMLTSSMLPQRRKLKRLAESPDQHHGVL